MAGVVSAVTAGSDPKAECVLTGRINYGGKRSEDHHTELHALLAAQAKELAEIRDGLVCSYCGSLEWTIETWGTVFHKVSCPFSQSNPKARRALRESHEGEGT